jgi:hypothetical protein
MGAEAAFEGLRPGHANGYGFDMGDFHRMNFSRL